MCIKPVAGAWIRTWYGNCSEDHDLQAIFVKYTSCMSHLTHGPLPGGLIRFLVPQQ